MSPADLAAEFDSMMARAGVVVPASRRQVLLQHYAALRDMIALLHTAHPPTLEPANVFRVTPPAPGGPV